MRALALAWGLAVALGAAGCAQVTGGGARAVYTGPITGTDARIALVTSRGALEGYVCGGPTTLTSATGWYRGEVLPGVPAVLADGAGNTLRLTLPGDGSAVLRGTLVLRDGRSLAWQAQSDDTTDLLDDSSDGCRTGVVLWSEGAERRAQGVYCDGSGVFEQVTPVRPWEWRDDYELRVRVLRPSGELLRWVRRVLAER